MIFKFTSFGLLAVWLGAIAPSFAGCFDQVTGDISNNFTSAVMCSNTLSQPTYQISYYEDSDVMFSMFSFDNFNAGYMCISHGEIEGDNLQCRKTGLRHVPSEFKNGGSTVFTFDFKSADSLRKFRSLFDQDFTFATTDDADSALVSKCFAGVRDDEVYLGFNSADIYPLSNCLFAFEEFIGKNPRAGLRLR